MTEKCFVLAIDQGTTGSTALILDVGLQVLGRANREFPQIYPQPGWVEHDPEAIWSSTCNAIRAALADARVRPNQIAAIGITNQRETTLLWQRSTGRPVHNAIVWQCRRTAPMCDKLRQEDRASEIRERTGLIVDAYFSATKLRWLLDNVADARRQAVAGQLAFGTVDTYLVWRLTNGHAHVTDASNASRTMLFNINQVAWDQHLLECFGIPREILPEVRPSSYIYGETHGLDMLPDGIPVAGIAGDQQAALFGHTCFSVGETKCTYGTGAFLLLNTGERIVRSKHGLLSSIAWQLGDQMTYCLEGSVFIAGAAVQWLRDGLGIIRKASEIEALASSVTDSGGVVFVPALVGLGAPYWNQEARGILTGLTRGTTAAHIARATLEGIAFEVSDVFKAMAADLGQNLAGSLRVDGGAAQNALLMQFQSDILQTHIVRPAIIETTAIGAALLAGLAVGLWPNPVALRETFRNEIEFFPSMTPERASVHINRWQQAVAMLNQKK